MSLDMDALLDAIRQVESSGNDRAVGPETKYGRAKGPYQFVDSTAREYGLDETSVFDPDRARGAARRYVGDLLQRYNGDLNKTLAAWNWGMGNLERKGMGAAPTETTDFITRVYSHYRPRGSDTLAQLAAAPQAPAEPQAMSLFPTASTRRPAQVMPLFPNDGGRFARTVLAGQNVPADRAARILRMGQRTGLPEGLIERNLDSLEAEAARRDFDAEAFRLKSPLVAEWMADSKNKAALAAVDYDAMSALEKAWASIKAVPGEFRRGAEEDRLMKLSYKVTIGTATPAEIAERNALKSRLTTTARELEGLPSWTGAAAKVLGQSLSLGTEALSLGAVAGLTGGATGAALGAAGGPGAPVTVPAGAFIGAVTGLKAGTAAGFVQGTYERTVGEAFDELENVVDANGQQLDPTVARVAALIIGAPNAALEIASASKALKLIPGADKLLSRLTIGQVKELLVRPSAMGALKEFAKKYAVAITTETVTEATQELIQILGREAATGDYGLPDERDLKAIASAAEQAFKASTVLGLAGVGPQMLQYRMEIAQAEHNQTVIRQLGEAAQSTLAQTSPEAFGDLSARLAQSATVKDIFIPIEQWDTVFGDQAPQAVKEVFGATDPYFEAKAHNGDLVIPVGLYAEKLAGTQFHQALAQDMRLSPGEMTLREAAVANQLQPELEATIEQQATEAVAKDAHLNQIYDDVKTKLTATGMGEISAHRNAMLWRELFNARAETLGMDPVALYGETPFTVQREMPGAGVEVLNQAPIETAAFKNWFGESKAVDEAGKPLVVYHGTNREFARFKKGVESTTLGGLAKHGFFFTPSPKAASRYATDFGPSGIVVPVFLKFDNPLTLSAIDYEKLQTITGKIDRNETLSEFEEIDLEQLIEGIKFGQHPIEAIQRAGYDAIVKREGRGGAEPEIMVFEPEQIRSAIQPFDPNDPRILFQKERGFFDPQHKTLREATVANQLQPEFEATIEQQAAEAVAKDAHLNQAPIETAAFKNWFGESKVVDEAGAPQVVYHGTPFDFESFDVNRLGQQTGGADAREGFFFAENPDAADQFTWYSGDKIGSIMPVYLSLKNPLVSSHHLSGASGTAAGAIIKQAKAEGHDGVIFTNSDMLGHKGRSYVVFKPTQVKSAIGNVGTFDPNDPRILFQKERGFFDPQHNIIGLLQTADPSTFLHESGHFWFEMLRRDALREDAPANLRKDWETVKAWTGATDEAISTEAHETFARGIEAYVMEGKAPSLTLREAFAQFAEWLVKIYKSMKMLDVQLTPEVRDVMDRMFATEQAIKEARKYNGYDRTAIPLEIFTPQEAEIYQSLSTQARAEAEENLRSAVLKQFTREKLADWRKGRDSILREIRSEMDGTPAWQALTWLQRGKLPEGKTLPDGMVHVRLDMEAVRGLGVEPKNLPAFSYQKEGGVSPSVLAEMFGFPDGRAVLQAIMSLPKRTEFIETESTRRMREQFGDLYGVPEELADKAAIEVQNSKQIDLFRMELRVLKRLGARKELAHPAVLRDLAGQVISRKRVGDLNPSVYEQAAIKAGNDAQEAVIARDYSQAFDAKQRQILNVFLHKEAARVRQTIGESVETWERTLFRKDERLARTRDMNLINAARAVVATHGIGKVEGTALGYLAQVQQYDPQTFDDLKDIVALSVSDGRNWKQLTVSEFQTLKDAVQGLTELSRRSKVMEIEGQKIERTAIKNELAVQIGQIVDRPVARLGYDRAVTNWEKFKAALKGTRAALRRVEFWVDAMDYGNGDTPFRKYIWQPISDAAIKFRRAREEVLASYLKLLEPIAKTITNEKISAPELEYTFSGKAELLGALLHSGNESNLTKLLRGRLWGDYQSNGEIDTTRWDAFITRAQQEGILTKADYDFVQSVWDLMNGLKAGAQKAHKDIYGFYFSEVTAKPFMTSYGMYEGGYFPAKADSFMSEDASIRADRNAVESTTPTTMFPAVARGFTKARVEAYAAPLALDLGIVPQHISDVLRLTHLGAPIRDVARLANDREFRNMVGMVDSEIVTNMIIPWLQRSSAQIVEQPMLGRTGRSMASFFRWVRTNTGLAIMAGNVVNAIEQVTGIAQAAIKVKPRYMAGALWRLVRNPLDYTRELHAKSVFLADRSATQMVEVQKAIEDITINPSVYQQIRSFTHRHGYFLQVGVQNVTDLIVWGGAYEQAVAEGLSETKAARAADSAVRQTQGSFAPEDISRFEAGDAFQRVFTMFTSYFNMSANLLGTEFVKAARQGGFGGAARGFYVYILGMMIPAIVSEAIRMAAKGEPIDDEDDDGYLDDFLGAFFFGQIKYAAGFVPVAGQLASAGLGAFDPGTMQSRVSLSPAVSMLETAARVPYDIYKLSTDPDEIKASRVTKDILSTVSIAFGVPILPLSRPLGYLMDVEQGYAEPENAIDFARGLVTGKPGGN